MYFEISPIPHKIRVTIKSYWKPLTEMLMRFWGYENLGWGYENLGRSTTTGQEHFT